MAQITLFSNKTTDGDGGVYAQAMGSEDNPGNLETVKVQLQGLGSLNGATCQVSIASDPDESPLNFSNTVGADASTVGTFTGAFSIVVEMVVGSVLACTIAGSGSPVPSFTVKARGHIQQLGS